MRFFCNTAWMLGALDSVEGIVEHQGLLQLSRRDHEIDEHGIQTLEKVGGEVVDIALQDAKLWDGLDIWSGETLNEADPRERVLALLAPLDSGSSLLWKLVDQNFVDQSIHVDDKTIFRHSLPKHGTEELAKQLRGLHVITLLRSPVSQLVSWIKAPYFLKNCTEAFVEGSTKPCFPDLSESFNRTDRKDKYNFREYPDKFNSLAEVYNSYANFYQELESRAAEFGIKSVTQVHFEDLVRNTEIVIRSIADRTGGLVSEFKQFTGHSKGGISGGRNEAVEKLIGRTYLQAIDKEEVRRFCLGLEGSWLQRPENLHPHTDDANRVYTYGHDCEE